MSDENTVTIRSMLGVMNEHGLDRGAMVRRSEGKPPGVVVLLLSDDAVAECTPGLVECLKTQPAGEEWRDCKIGPRTSLKSLFGWMDKFDCAWRWVAMSKVGGGEAVLVILRGKDLCERAVDALVRSGCACRL